MVRKAGTRKRHKALSQNLFLLNRGLMGTLPVNFKFINNNHNIFLKNLSKINPAEPFLGKEHLKYLYG
jgi:hypothetical protein